MQVDHVRLVLRLTVPEAILQGQLHSSPAKVGEQLATVIDQYRSKHRLRDSAGRNESRQPGSHKQAGQAGLYL